MALVLVHSPLVGPSTWEPVARELEHRGFWATVPALVAVTDRSGPLWPSLVSAVDEAVRSAGPDRVALVAHSGAGVLLPAIGHALSAEVAAYVFVDAGLPPLEGVGATAPAAFRQFLSELAIDGRLPPWSQWWGPEAMSRLVPDPAARGRIESELPSLPLTYFKEEVPVPMGWAATPCAYLQLSAAYENEKREAEARGWPVEVLDAAHLHAVVDPVGVAELIVRLFDRLGALRPR